jgi:hypothetical protein
VDYGIRSNGSTTTLARDIRGIGFKTADAIAMKLGVEKTAMIRVRAGISYALTEAMDDGHCGLDVPIFILITSLVMADSKKASVSVIDLEGPPFPSRNRLIIEPPPRVVPNISFHFIPI